MTTDKKILGRLVLFRFHAFSLLATSWNEPKLMNELDLTIQVFDFESRASLNTHSELLREPRWWKQSPKVYRSTSWWSESQQAESTEQAALLCRLGRLLKSSSKGVARGPFFALLNLPRENRFSRWYFSQMFCVTWLKSITFLKGIKLIRSHIRISARWVLPIFLSGSMLI